MSETPCLPVAVLDHPVWSKLSHYIIGPETASLPFEYRLARENGWRADFTRQVVEEYRRFVFLATVAGHEVTPSDAVDQAWHLHLTYTRDYWERFCPTVIGRPLHHGPTAGGANEQHRFFDQYAATLAAMNAGSARRRRLISGPMRGAASFATRRCAGSIQPRPSSCRAVRRSSPPARLPCLRFRSCGCP